MITKVSYCFALDKPMDWGRCMFCQKDSIAPLLDPYRNRNNTICGMSISKAILKNFKEMKFRFMFESLCT